MQAVKYSTTSLDKRAIQEAEYALPRHWLLRRTVRIRYERLSALFAGLIGEHVHSGGLVVDVGCGDGKGTFDLHDRIGSNYELCGVDYSERAIMLARAMTPGSGLRFDVLQAEELGKLSEEMEPSCLLYREVIEHLSDAEVDSTLKSAGCLLRHGGVLIISVPSTNTPVSSKHYRHYTGPVLRVMLEERGFDVLQIIGFGYRPRWLCRVGLWVNELPTVWRILNPLWRTVDPRRAHTLIAVGRKPE